MTKEEIIKKLQDELTITNERIKVRESRFSQLVNELPYHFLFGNKLLCRKYAQFIFNHGEAIEELNKKKEKIIVTFKKLHKVA